MSAALPRAPRPGAAHQQAPRETAPQERAPLAVRAAALTTFLVGAIHIVFGAVVRISGSGMGCQDSWPKCRHPDGRTYWFPPLDNPQIVIEWTHRLLASLLLVSAAALVVVAWRHRRRLPAVLPPAAAVLGFGLLAAAFGAVTVFLENPAWATAVHKAIAAGLIAAAAAAVIRGGLLGGRRLAGQVAGGARASGRTARAALVGAGLTLSTIVMGAMTAKTPGAAVACQGFPLCGPGSTGGAAQHIQLTHRALAYLVALHVLGLAVAVARRREAGVLVAGARAAVGVVTLQILLAVGMLHTHFTVAAVRSLHQATGMLLWVTLFSLWYLARSAAEQSGDVGADAPARATGRLTPAGGAA
jgi:heme A synthase